MFVLGSCLRAAFYCVFFFFIDSVVFFFLGAVMLFVFFFVLDSGVCLCFFLLLLLFFFVFLRLSFVLVFGWRDAGVFLCWGEGLLVCVCFGGRRLCGGVWWRMLVFVWLGRVAGVCVLGEGVLVGGGGGGGCWCVWWEEEGH